MKWQRAWVWPVLIVLMGTVCWLVFIADGWRINRLVLRIWGALARLGLVLPIAVVDIAANVVMLAPLVFLLGIGLPKVWWWVWGVLGCAGSGAIELLQGAYLARIASWTDWVANSVGAFLAAGAAHLTNRWLQRRETVQPHPNRDRLAPVATSYQTWRARTSRRRAKTGQRNHTEP